MTKRIRFWLLVFFAFIRRFFGLLVIGALVGIAISIILPLITPLAQRFSKIERIGIVGRFNLETFPSVIQEEISIGLTRLDEQKIAGPALAREWESREDGRVWIFKLDESRRWQDNKPVTAADINYKFEGVEVKKPDSQTLEFHLKDPYSPFPIIVSRPVFKRGLLGAGEFKAASVVLTGRYIEKLLLEPVKGRGVRKLYKFYPTEDAAISAFKLGEVDILTDIFDLQELASWKNLQTSKETQFDRYVAVFFNTQDSTLASKSLRQALAYAINKEELGEERAISPISPESWAYNPLVKPYDYNVTRAKELLEELPKEQRDNLTIKLVTIPSLLSKAERIAIYWQALGVKTQIQVSNTPPQEFQALLATQAIPHDPDQYSLWHSTQEGTNITKYKDPRIDKLLEDGRRILAQEERKKVYIDYQRFLVEDSPAIFLYHPETFTVIRK